MMLNENSGIPPPRISSRPDTPLILQMGEAETEGTEGPALARSYVRTSEQAKHCIRVLISLLRASKQFVASGWR